MKHHATPEFWSAFDALPLNIKTLAKKNYELLKEDTKHPSLHFKPVGAYWSARVGSNYRALAVRAERDVFVWFWIGTHTEYDKLIK